MFFPACTRYSAPISGAAATVSATPPTVFAVRRASCFHSGISSIVSRYSLACRISVSVYPSFFRSAVL